jgi:hypothetical protein
MVSPSSAQNLALPATAASVRTKWWGQASPEMGRPTLARFAEQADTFAGTDVLAMDMSAGEFGQLDVAGDDQFLARGRPAPQPEHGAPQTLVHHPSLTSA